MISLHNLRKKWVWVLIKTKNPKTNIVLGTFMWYLQESNQGHTDFQSVALPTELRYHYLKLI